MFNHRKTVSEGTDQPSITVDELPQAQQYESPLKNMMTKAEIIQQVQQSPLTPLTPMADDFMLKTPKLAKVNFESMKNK